MKVTSLKAALAAVSVATFASACSHVNAPSTIAAAAAVKAAACGVGSDVKLSPAQLALTNEMQKFEPCFDSTKTFLSAKIGGITLESISTPVVHEGSDDAIEGSSSVTVKGSLILRASEKVFTFSGTMNVNDLRTGKVFDLTVADTENKLPVYLGGLLDIKARCMDMDCKSVSMWLESAQLERSNTLGVIFTADASGTNYAVSNSTQAMIVSVADYKAQSYSPGPKHVEKPVTVDSNYFPLGL